MPSRSVHNVARAAGRVPGLRRVPAVALVSAAEVMLLARDHLRRLTPEERRRLVALVRAGRGGRRRLSPSERRELEAIMDKLEPRALVGEAVTRLSPVPLPNRIVYGPKSQARR